MIEYIINTYFAMIRTYIEELRVTGDRLGWIDEKIIAETGCEMWHLVEAYDAVNNMSFGGEIPYTVKAPKQKSGPKPLNTTGADDTMILKRQEEYITF